MYHPKLSAACLAAVVLLGGCSTGDLLSPYRIDVRQGNDVTPEMVAQLKPGMSPDQVRFVLGTPLIVDPFHQDRWDYFYRNQPGRGEPSQKRLTVFFQKGVLAEFRGDIEAAPADRVQPPTRVIEIDAKAPAGGS
ncbi:MAG: outer membrane protein assembly factor BamE [Rhodocyclaceae bacterium]|nr:outer membrane protein assembly factor BamE [Rhodocyclaceae bacterium]